MDDAVRNHAVFSKNRDRLLTSEVAQRFFAEVNRQGKKFMSDEHFTVDGTLIQAWASQKSFRSKDDSDDDDGANFHGQKRIAQIEAGCILGLLDRTLGLAQYSAKAMTALNRCFSF
jgi:hypothetical protein